jgi:hypothetical protein
MQAWYPVDDEELEGLTEEELAEMTKEPEPYAGQVLKFCIAPHFYYL